MSEPTADDLADIALPHMPHSRRVIGRLATTRTEPPRECAACGDLWLKAAQEALRRAERAEAQIARVRALLDGGYQLVGGMNRMVYVDGIRAALDGEATP